jgi:hypothetical protein
MIAGVVFAAYVAIHARCDQTGCDYFAEKEVVEPEIIILLIAISPVGPEDTSGLLTTILVPASSIRLSDRNIGCT